MTAGHLGFINTPLQGNRLVDGAAWCADNGCFGAGYPGDKAWWAWITGLAAHADTCAFVVAPDVVSDATATLERSMPFLLKIRALGFPVAFVAQDGATVDDLIPWGHFDVLFVGGSTGFKLGVDARAIVAEAKRRGNRVHMGRVNSFRRLRYAKEIGCDSADGTFITFGPDVHLPKVLAWVDRVNNQGVLW